MTVHSPVCVIKLSHVVTVFHRLLLIRTVTCRQFPNLTFAPRKTCHHVFTCQQQPLASQLSCHSSLSITNHRPYCKYFFIFFCIFFFFMIFVIYLNSQPILLCYLHNATPSYTFKTFSLYIGRNSFYK